MKLAEEHLGEHLPEISTELWEQERKLWTNLDAFEWPEGYREMQELITFYYTDHPEELRQMLSLEERLAGLQEDSPEVERLAEDFARHLEQTPFPYDPLKGLPLASEPLSNVFSEVLLANFSPARQRVMDLVQKRFEERDES